MVAEQLGIRLHIRECHREFEQNVIPPLPAREYKAGRTPNPCILCNPSTKFGLICQAAKEMGFDFIATGHYARIDHQADGTAVLQKSSCLERDQSYMLYRLSQEQLAMLLLPLEGLEKPQVREIARQLGLVCADAPDSQEICWLPDGDYAAFIEQTLGKTSRETLSHRTVRSAAGTRAFCTTPSGSASIWAWRWGIRSLSRRLTRNKTASTLPAPGRSTPAGCC